MASGDTLLIFTPFANEPPTADYATPDVRNAHPVLDFDDTANEAAVFSGVMPARYGGGGVTIDLYWMGTSATSGSSYWEAAFERLVPDDQDLDADGFAAAQAANGAANGASGKLTKTSITFTDGAQMDSLGAGEPFRLKINRHADHESDDMVGDAELLWIVIRET